MVPSGRTSLQPQNMIGGDAVGQRVRSAGILRHVAADGAGALAGGIGRVEVAAALDRQRDVEIDDAGLYHRPLVFESISRMRFMRAKAIMMPPSRGMAPPERPVPAPRPTNGTLDSCGDATIAATSSVVRGKTTISGRCLSTPPSYS